jgi:hypothetical protein
MLIHDYWGVFSYQSVCGNEQPYERYLSAQPFFYVDPQYHLLRSYRQGGTVHLAPQLSSTLCRVGEEALDSVVPVSRTGECDEAIPSLRQITHFG